MKNIGFKLFCIVALLALCAWSIFPPKERIRLGKDLRGGVSLIYHVDIPDDFEGDRSDLIAQTIDVLISFDGPTWGHFYEDGAKFLGIAAWLSFFLVRCWSLILSALWSGTGAGASDPLRSRV